MTDSATKNASHEFNSGAGYLCKFVVRRVPGTPEIVRYGQPRDAAIHRAPEDVAFCDCLMPLGSKTCHHCKKPVRQIHRPSSDTAPDPFPLSTLPAEPPSVQCDRCKNWVPQDTVKVQVGVTFCAHCQDEFLNWVAVEASDTPPAPEVAADDMPNRQEAIELLRSLRNVSPEDAEEQRRTYALLEEALSRTCKWTLDPSPDFEVWESACGESWQFENEGPKENKMRFCCYCGKRLEEVVIRHDDE